MRQQEELVQLDGNTLIGVTFTHSIDYLKNGQFTY
jgi:hypothetical protein